MFRRVTVFYGFLAVHFLGIKQPIPEQVAANGLVYLGLGILSLMARLVVKKKFLVLYGDKLIVGGLICLVVAVVFSSW